MGVRSPGYRIQQPFRTPQFLLTVYSLLLRPLAARHWGGRKTTGGKDKVSVLGEHMVSQRDKTHIGDIVTEQEVVARVCRSEHQCRWRPSAGMTARLGLVSVIVGLHNPSMSEMKRTGQISQVNLFIYFPLGKTEHQRCSMICQINTFNCLPWYLTSKYIAQVIPFPLFPQGLSNRAGVT